MQKPDAVIARDLRSEVEHRIGIEPIDQLLHDRSELVKQVSSLRARYGSFGTWDAIRKTELAKVAQLVRAEKARDGGKVTEALIEESAHADGRYVDQIIRATEERAEWAKLEDQIQAINDKISRDQALCRFVAAEVSLSR